MKEPLRGQGPHHERTSGVREATIAPDPAPCPFSSNCEIVELHDQDGTVQAIACRLCTLLERRSDLHYQLTGTPGVGI